MLEIFIGVGILGLVMFSGYLIGKTIASYKYASKIDKLKARLENREDKIDELYEKIRKGKLL